LFLWNNEYAVSLIAKSRDVVMPVVYPALVSNTEKHWNSTVHGLTLNVKKLFQEMDITLWEENTKQYQAEQERARVAAEQRARMWEQLQSQHQGK